MDEMVGCHHRLNGHEYSKPWEMMLDLTDRVADKLWMEVRDTAEETGIKTILKKKKCKKEKWLSEEALQIAVKRREEKNKGEKEKNEQI